VNEARVSAMKQAGENWFGGYALPMAILRLKQGIGRLLRTKDDRGVMAILDKRLYTKSYGTETLRALPPPHAAPISPRSAASLMSNQRDFDPGGELAGETT
jgi:Rad3-related DNA helicase